jgi:V/A-type H+-transporting ATPase subunit D
MPKAVLGIRPTRIELLKLRRREVVAQKGHDLLQEKLDAMVIRFQQTQKELEGSEEIIKKGFHESYDTLKKAGMITGYSHLEEISGAIPERPRISMGVSRIIGVKVPTIEDTYSEEDTHRGYSYIGTNGQVDETVQRFVLLLSALIRHAELEGTARSLAHEISSCRRRVNALEQIIIPSLINTQRYIEMRLEEREREDLFRRKRTKQLQHREQVTI